MSICRTCRTLIFTPLSPSDDLQPDDRQDAPKLRIVVAFSVKLGQIAALAEHPGWMAGGEYDPCKTGTRGVRYEGAAGH
jgi:hypothetical protein